MTGKMVSGDDETRWDGLLKEEARPLVSIIMANYNGAKYIDAALKSALAQSLSDVEVIVADDASADDSADRAAVIAARDPRVRVLRTIANGGPAAARNRCLEVARGRWIAIMDSDDLMHPERLEYLVSKAERDVADIAADDLLVFHDAPGLAPSTCLSGEAVSAAFWVDAAAYIRANVLFGGTQALGYLKPLIRSRLIHECDLRYDTTLPIAEDYDFILRLLLRGARFRIYPRLLYFYRKHEKSISHRLSRRTLEPMLAAHDKCRAIIDGQEPGVDAAMDTRRASIQMALDFDDLVAALKRRAWRDALVIAVRRPAAAALLRGPILDRLRRFGGKRSSGSPNSRHQICVISRQRIIGATNGNWAYLLSLCTALSQNGYDVHLLCPTPEAFGGWPMHRPRPGLRVFRSIRLRGSRSVGSLLVATSPAVWMRALLGFLGLPPGTRRDGPDTAAAYAASPIWTRGELLFVARHARDLADVVIADNAFATDGIPYALRPESLSLVVVHDLFSGHSTQLNRLDATHSVPEISQNDEMALLSKADVVMVDQEDEATTVRRCLAVGRVITAPMAVVPAAMPQVGRGRSVLFVGGDTATDTTGLSWFLEDVWPAVRAGVPDAIFWIAGPVCRTVRRVPDGVELRATVRDLTTLYKEAAVVVSPQPEGSGLNINLAEAFGHGKAVVATGVMLRGMMLEACGAVASGATASADKPADFAAAVVALLLDEGQRMAYAKACLEMAHARLSPAACHAEFLALVSAANPGKSPVFS